MNFIRFIRVLTFTIGMSPFLSSNATPELSAILAHPTVSTVKLSPDGDYFASRILIEGRYNLVIYNTASKESISVIGFGKKSEIGDFQWVNKDRLLVSILTFDYGEAAPSNYGELYSINADGSDGEMVYGYRAHEAAMGSKLRKKKADFAHGEVIDLIPSDPSRVLIASTPMSNEGNIRTRVHSLHVYSGTDGRKVLTAINPDASFIVDKNSEVRLVASTDINRIRRIHTVKEGQQTEVPINLYGANFSPVSVDDSGLSIFAIDDLNSDKLGLYKYSLEDFSSKMLYANKNVSITSLIKTVDNTGVYAMRIDDGYPSYLLFSKTMPEAVVFKSLLTEFSGMIIDIISRTDDGKLWTIRVSQDTKPGSFFLFDSVKSQLTLLHDSIPELANKESELATVEPVSFKSFDENVINGYLTKPRNPTGELVVLVHGGPRLRDYWGFDAVAQAFASKGISVLQINFRGSSGYGNSFLHAGDLQWGQNVQKDIIWGAKWALTKKVATPGKICIAGSSFGAYSAVQSAIMEPDLFSCVIANAGIYDLNLLHTEGDAHHDYYGDAFLSEVIGNDKQLLNTYSPVYNVKALKAPILIAHGEKDERAPIIHAENLRHALTKAEKNFSWLVKNNEGHGFYSVENNVLLLEKSIAFIKANTESK